VPRNTLTIFLPDSDLFGGRPWRVAPILRLFINHNEGGPGPSLSGTGEESVPIELNRSLSRLFCRELFPLGAHYQ